jgi:Transglutaminase-like superfamily
MFAATTPATDFTVESYVPNVTATELRSSPATYPQDILDRYLVLPYLVPDRVRKLAQQITQDQTNPYDKAKAIETFLRTNYPYDLKVPAPPEGREIADYFLFDLKKGYCDYYATTMVVMARAVGIPARFVSGYSPGSYDAPNAEYVIRELNAHSWAEVYFTGIGWVEFEPTGSIPEIVRSDTGVAPLPSNENESAASRLLNRFRLEKVTYTLLPVFVVIAIVLLYFMLIEKWWQLRLSPVNAIERIYRKFYRAGRPFAGIQTHAETSHEFANKLIDKLIELEERSSYKAIFARLKNNVSALTDLYNLALFTDNDIQKKDANTAWDAWKQLRWRLWFARIILYQANRITKTNRAWLQGE